MITYPQILKKLETLDGVAGHTVCFIHLSRLRAENRRSSYLRIAATSFDDFLFKHQMVYVDVLPNQDLIFVGHHVDQQELQHAVLKIRELFFADPFSKNERSFSTFFNIDSHYKECLEFVKKMAEENTETKEEEKEEEEIIYNEMSLAWLDPIERALRNIDLFPFLQHKPVFSLDKKNVIFYEKVISLKEFLHAIMPNVDYSFDPLLTQFVSEKLNAYLLGKQQQESIVQSHGMFSIRISIKIFLSQLFQEFEKGIKGFPPENIILDFSAIDIVANFDVFHEAIELLNAKKYRSCISFSTPSLLSFLAPLPVHYVKIPFQKNATFNLASYRKNFSSQFILTKCHQEEAIRVGEKSGFDLFQGHALEKN